MSRRKVFLDNTILTNFAQAGRQDLVFSLWGNMACTTASAMREYQVGVQSSNLPVEAWKKLPVHDLLEDEVCWVAGLPPKLGEGECGCLAAALHQQGVFASDDQQARKIASRLGLAVTGSIGILVHSVQKGLLSKAEAQELLERMIQAKYHSPISDLDEILDIL